MRKGTLQELDVVISLLRRFQVTDPEADILVHDMARRLELLRPFLRNGEPVTERLDVVLRPIAPQSPHPATPLRDPSAPARAAVPITAVPGLA